jgi:hypothetical protein
VRYIVAFEKMGKNSTAAERIGLERHENKDWWRQRVVGSLKMEI